MKNEEGWRVLKIVVNTTETVLGVGRRTRPE